MHPAYSYLALAIYQLHYIVLYLKRACLLQIRTVIGHGSGKAGSHGVHGAPLGSADLKAVKAKFGFDPELVSLFTF